MSDPTYALKAYGAAAALPKAGAATSVTAAAGGFGDMVTQAMTQTVDQLQTAESLAGKMPSGQANMIDVVTAVTAAEHSMNTVLTVRDQMVEAYKELMRMPI